MLGRSDLRPDAALLAKGAPIELHALKSSLLCSASPSPACSDADDPAVFQNLGETVYTDHPPAHIHAIYQDFEAKLAIETGDVIEGRLPPAVLRIAREWMRRHQSELAENWRRAREELPLERIPGADVD
jgi:hypothetical protein